MKMVLVSPLVLADKEGTDTVSSKHTERFTTGINNTGRHAQET